MSRMKRLEFPPPSSIPRYDLSEFKAFIEELEHTVELLESRRLTNERMALVILDSLADRLLFQNARIHFRASEELWMLRGNGYTRDEQARTLRDFGAKVSLATKEPASLGSCEPMLNELDAEIFRIAHRYRNMSYHGGRHNDTLAGPLSRLYAAAIGRAFCRRGVSYVLGGIDDALLEDLDRFDWRNPGKEPGVFPAGTAAERIISTLISRIEVQAKALAADLQADLDARCGVVEGALEALKDWGLTEGGLESLLAGAQHWATHRGDPVLVRLAEERRQLIKSCGSSSEPPPSVGEAYLDNELATSRRMQELSKQTDLRFNLGSAARIRRRGQRLISMRDEARLLNRYQQLDLELEQLEESVQWVEMEWHREVEREAEIARGK
jgi:hypothetical protein